MPGAVLGTRNRYNSEQYRHKYSRPHELDVCVKSIGIP